MQWLERILIGHQPPNLVDPESPECLDAQMQVAGMSGVERAAEKANAAPRRAAKSE